MLPVAATRGSSRTTYVPVALRSSANVRPVGLTSTAPSVVPFGRRIVTRDDEIETDDSTNETRRPAVPWNVRRAFCPGVPIATASAEPPTTSSPETSGGTSYSVRVIEPVVAPIGSTAIEKVPVEGRRRASTNAPALPTRTFRTTNDPSGARTDT